MTDTNRLLRIKQADVAESDLLKLWASRYGGEVALSLAVLKDWLGVTDAGDVVPLTTQYASPDTNDFNILVENPSAWLVMTPTTSFALGTITFPASTGVIDKSEILITTTQQIASVTFNGNGASAVIGAPSSLAAADAVKFRYDAQSFSWYRISST